MYPTPEEELEWWCDDTPIELRVWGDKMCCQYDENSFLCFEKRDDGAYDMKAQNFLGENIYLRCVHFTVDLITDEVHVYSVSEVSETEASIAVDFLVPG